MEFPVIFLEPKLKQKKCQAKVIKRIAPMETQKLFHEIARLQGREDEFEIVMEECVSWTEADEKIELGQDFWKMVKVLSIDIFTSERERIPQVLVSFYNTFGPLFKTPVMPISEIMLYIEAFFLSVMTYKQIFEPRPGMPPAVGILTEYLYEPLLEAKEKYPDNKEMWELWGIYHTNPKVVLKPATKKAKFLIPSPPENIESSREKIIRWIRRVVLLNIDRNLRAVKYKSSFNQKTGKFSLKAVPKDAYTLAVLQATVKDLGYQACERCGKPTKSILCTNCSRKRNVKQTALAYFRNLKNEGKITPGIYEKIKEEANRIKASKVKLTYEEFKERLCLYMEEMGESA